MTLFSFILTLAFSSTIIGLLCLAIASIIPRARHWPLFWGVCLVASISVAVLALAFSGLAALMPQDKINALPIYSALGPVTWPGLIETNLQQVTAFAWSPFLSKILVITYLSGALISLLRLGTGRYRAAKIVKFARKFERADGTIVDLTDEPLTCMTVTPLGRPHRSRIILSEAFHDTLSATELERVFAHENGHIMRRDDEFGLLLRVVVALLWFNPIMHNVFDRWTMSAELQCDQIATKDESYQMRRAYADTLLKALYISADRVRQYPAASLSTQHLRNEKMRIKQIMTGPAPIFKQVRHKFTFMTLAMGTTLMGAVFMSAVTGTELTPRAYADPVPQADPDVKARVNPSKFSNSFNLAGTLTSSFGEAPDPFKKGNVRNHFGVDYKAPTGTPIYAPAEGVITVATDLFNNNANYGKVVIIQTHGGVQTMMAHLDSYVVETGQRVLKGQKLAEIGNTGKSTGPHVHIETRLNGKLVDPMTVWILEK